MSSVPDNEGDGKVVQMNTRRRMAIDWANLPVHPAAAAWPEMSDAQIDELVKDIDEHGLQIPLVVFEDNSEVVNGNEGPYPQYLLDGRSRRKALAKTGTTPANAKAGEGGYYPEKYRIVKAMKLAPISFPPSDADAEPRWISDVDPYAFVFTVNAHRLHLNSEQKRQAIAAAIAARPHASDREIARQTGTDNKTVAKARGSSGEEFPHRSDEPSEEMKRARDALIDEPDRTNVEIAKVANVSDFTIRKARKQLEEEGRIGPRTPTPRKSKSNGNGKSKPTTTKSKGTTRSKGTTTTTTPRKTKQQLREEETARTSAEAAAWLKEHAAADELPAWITWLETMDNKVVLKLLEKKE